MTSVQKKYGIKTTDKETLRRWYYLLYLGRCLDEKAPSYLLQSIGWQFHASNAGHDGIQGSPRLRTLLVADVTCLITMPR